jgi:hypothetical protein
MDTWDTCDEDDRRMVIAGLRRQAEELAKRSCSRERAAAYRVAAELLERETALGAALLDAAE